MAATQDHQLKWGDTRNIRVDMHCFIQLTTSLPSLKKFDQRRHIVVGVIKPFQFLQMQSRKENINVYMNLINNHKYQSDSASAKRAKLQWACQMQYYDEVI